MTPQECWATYVGEKSPEQFVREFDTRDPEKCAARFVHEQGVVFGIVRHGAWPQTFASEQQYTRDTVVALLTSHLEDHRASWEAVPISVGPPATWEAIEAATDHSAPDDIDHELEQYLHEHDTHGGHAETAPIAHPTPEPIVQALAAEVEAMPAAPSESEERPEDAPEHRNEVQD